MHTSHHHHLLPPERYPKRLSTKRHTIKKHFKSSDKQGKRAREVDQEWEGLSDRAALKQLAFELMKKNNLLTEFTTEETKELNELVEGGDERLSASHKELYRDLRHLPWVSIDNDDTRDIDQLTAAEELPNGNVRILISVADCDYLIPKDSLLDKHAGVNCASVYTPAHVFTMLPLLLSYDITSLNPFVDRKSFVIDVVMRSADEAEIIEETVYLAIVNNKAKLAYPSMSLWLKGEDEMPPALTNAQDSEKLAGTIRIQDRVARAILKKRRTNGALEFESLQAHVVWDQDEILDLVSEKQNRAQKLIENFMLTANGVVSRFLQKYNSSSIQRVVKEPEKWSKIREFTSSYGFPLPNKPDNMALRRFLAIRREEDPVSFPDVSLTIIKLMGMGEYIFTSYDEASLGHFGLAVVDYTHSTAPNRRYPDLITQRLVRNILLGLPPPYSGQELDAIATQCTEMQTAAAKVERHLIKSAAALLLHDKIGEIFDGVVTGTKESNTWVRLLSLPVEGRLMSRQALQVGEKVRVELVSTNSRCGFIDFVNIDSKPVRDGGRRGKSGERGDQERGGERRRRRSGDEEGGGRERKRSGERSGEERGGGKRW
eukprot:TRINITY_DN15009_c0_g1_i1.p1 TRINITY_DN15009_c0_g1~~TRINITY_DN15009_c0_g1_i1.p1  ORF type:complete len:616 (-),score=146.09 TRINITY_DN15009_c0_g1_i1:79-1881(-)